MHAQQTRIFGTKGELEGDGEDKLTHFDFLTRKTRVIQPSLEVEADDVDQSGHGGGDFALMRAFVFACVTGNKDYVLSGPQATLGKSFIFPWDCRRAHILACITCYLLCL